MDESATSPYQVDQRDVFKIGNYIVNGKLVVHCCLLAALAWPGPRPKIHDHAVLSRSGGSDSGILSRHLALHHSDQVEPNEHRPHCHWTFGELDAGLLASTPSNPVDRLIANTWSETLRFLAMPINLQESLSGSCFSQDEWEYARIRGSSANDLVGLDFHRFYCTWTC